jgi:hypothetical protein
LQEKNKAMNTDQAKRQERKKMVADFVAKLFQVERKEEEGEEKGKEMTMPVAMASSNDNNNNNNKQTFLY